MRILTHLIPKKKNSQQLNKRNVPTCIILTAFAKLFKL